MEKLLAAPDWTNPNVGMIALIAGTINEFGEDGRRVVTGSLFKLGLKTGEYMIEKGLVPAGASPTEWGRFTLQLMDLTGFYDYEEVEATDRRYQFKVTRYPYLDAFRYLEAPPDACDIPGYWDRGCLATINPDVEMTHPKCFWQGDPYCLWSYELRSM
jgi:hypothetical protein